MHCRQGPAEPLSGDCDGTGDGTGADLSDGVLDIPAVDLVTERVPAVPLAPYEHVHPAHVPEQPFDLRIELVGLFRMGTDRSGEQAPDGAAGTRHPLPPGQHPALFGVGPGVVPATQVFGATWLALGPVEADGLVGRAPMCPN